jgi:diphthine synthase
VLRAKEAGLPVHVIHNASIMNAAGACGLQLYNFGQTVSIPYFRDEWRPDSFYDKIAYNAKGGMHTLCLLDIKVREPNYDAMASTGRLVYDPPRFMTVNEACLQLLEVEARRGEGFCTPESMAIGLARVGQDTQRIVSGPLAELATVDFGAPLHSLVLVGAHMHDLERSMLALYRNKPGQYPVWKNPKDEEPEDEGDAEPCFFSR